MSIDVYQTSSNLILCLDKPSHLRNSDNLDVIYNSLKRIKAYSGLHPYLLQQMCLEVRYERLKDKIVVYQGGKPEKNCYVVMSGSLIVVDIEQLSDILTNSHLLHSAKLFTIITEGCAFGNNFQLDSTSKKNRNPFSVYLSDSKAVVTQQQCELLYMDQKVFQEIWSKNEKFFKDLNMSRDISAMESALVATHLDSGSSLEDIDVSSNSHSLSAPVRISNPGLNPSIGNAAHFIFKSCKPLLLTCLPSQTSAKFPQTAAATASSSSSSFSRVGAGGISGVSQVMMGEDMISWMRQIIRINSRLLAIGIWQVLLEDNALISLTSPYLLRDTSVDFYVFNDDFFHGGSSANNSSTLRSSSAAAGANSSNSPSEIVTFDDLDSCINFLMKLAPDALFRMILHKPAKERTKEELEFIFSELLHIKALSHLSSMVKRQLAIVLRYEIHPYAGKALFCQGSEGTSWYIIVKGSVDVHIKGKGVVCRLKTNDDFGKLALVNNSPRAATILLRENDCHFLKIDKEDFNRILRNVEVNTVRLKEHGRDVLLFEKRVVDSPGRKIGASFGANQSSSYSVMAGTPEKLIDHILENSIDINKSYASILDRISTVPNPILETFILTYFCFLTSHGLCSLLLVYFQSYNDSPGSLDGRATPIEDKEHDYMVVLRKTRVVHFLYWWCRISDGAFFDDRVIQTFAENLLNLVSNDQKARVQLNREFLALSCLLEQFQKTELLASRKVGQRSKFSRQHHFHRETACNSSSPSSGAGGGAGTSSSAAAAASVTNSNRPQQQLADIPQIKAKDLAKFTVYFSSGFSCLLRLAVDSPVEQIIGTLCKHQNLPSKTLCLCEVRSDGERLLLDPEDVGVMYSSVMGSRLFLLALDDQKELSPLVPPGVAGNDSAATSNHLSPVKKETTSTVFDSTSIDELAFHLTFLDWQLFKNIQVHELLVKVLGRPRLSKITANLDCFICQFTSVQFWAAAEVCQSASLSKRVSVLKKLIKLASRLSELKNISSSFAVLMGLNNSAVTRLQSTWDRVSNKHKKIFQDLCSLLDPTRNHCAFRQYLKKTQAPIIPFVAIMLKDLTFINEANKTYFDEHMINFEKMQLFAATLHQFLACRARPMIFENSSGSGSGGSGSKRDQGSGGPLDLQIFVRGLSGSADQRYLTQLSLALETRGSGSSHQQHQQHRSSAPSAANTSNSAFSAAPVGFNTDNV